MNRDMSGSVRGLIDDMLSGSVAGNVKFESGGSNVTITPTLESGTKIADFTIDDTTGELYAPTPEPPIEYTAGDNITIEDGVISATDTTYTAGSGITIEDGVISASSSGNSYNKLLDLAFATNMNFAYANNSSKYFQYLRATSGYEGMCLLIDYDFIIGHDYKIEFDYNNTQTSFNNNYAWQASITNFTNGFDIGGGSKNLPQTATTQKITLTFTADAVNKYLTFYMSASSSNCNNTFENLVITDITE